MGPSGPDRSAGGFSLVAAEVVQDDNVAWRERGGEYLLDVEPEEFAVDRAVDHPGRVDAIVTQGGDEGEGVGFAALRVQCP